MSHKPSVRASLAARRTARPSTAQAGRAKRPCSSGPQSTSGHSWTQAGRQPGEPLRPQAGPPPS
eukprot:6651139-Pyramimonas_sp.AAC.1